MALPTFFLLQLLLVPSIVLGPIRPLFEGPLRVPRLAADYSAEFVFTGLRAECRPDIAILFWPCMEGASSLKVRAWQNSSATAVDSAPPSPARHCASEGFSQHLTMAVKKSDSHAHPPGSPGSHAPLLPPRCQDASSWWRRRFQRESDGARATWRAAVVIVSFWYLDG